MRRAIAAIPAGLGLAAASGLVSPLLPAPGRENVMRAEITVAEVAARVPPPAVDEPPYGAPLGGDAATRKTIRRRGYVLSYDEARHNPAWVAYSYVQSGELHEGHVRVASFAADVDTAAGVTEDDYTKSGYSRGHMAPSFGIFKFFGKDAQRETYLMSNIVPQKQPLNAGPWEDAEDRSANKFAERFARVWTIDGPVYGKQPQTIAARKIHVPEATFKIIVRYDEAAQQPAVLAFLMPQEARQKDAAVEYLSSVDEIERRTGLDFLSELPDDLEDALEAPHAVHLW